MPDKLQAPKGTQDILPAESWKWQAIETAARTIAGRYAFSEIRTPVFEHTELFHRGVGEATDIVSKETYTFDDRGGRSLTLRPEGTASVVRAVLQAGLLDQEGARAKVFYLFPMLRYERPQKGRMRQHHQFGVEAFGVADAQQDVECIALQRDFYDAIGLKNLHLRVNSLGDAESKARYRDQLREFLEPKQSALSDDSQRRLETNPLRILDSKVPGDLDACVGAPLPSDALSDSSKAHFDKTCQLLTDLGVAFDIDANLVRGLDYYTETLWEFVATDIGAQSAVGGGGRYDTLVQTLGGRPTPGVGFGLGIERVLLALEAQATELSDARPPLVWIVNTTDVSVLPLMHELRAAGIAVDADLTGRSVKAQFKLADRSGAAKTLVVGDAFEVKDMATGTQSAVTREGLIDALR
ncbi:MAG: histidine--tRNA ligase [Planctomycetota bacterium]